MVHVLIISEAKKGAKKMKIMEIDLQNIALIKLRGKLDIDSVQAVVKKAHDLLDKNRFRVIIDIGKVQTNDLCLISLSNFLNEFKKKAGIIKILPSSRGGLMKIELYKLPMAMSMSVYNTNLH
jgi:ABC-type transporter Mla MlaB component